MDSETLIRENRKKVYIKTIIITLINTNIKVSDFTLIKYKLNEKSFSLMLSIFAMLGRIYRDAIVFKPKFFAA